MITPGNINQPYKTLYHDFTDAYTHLYQMSKDLYPAARRFVEKNGPEISHHLSKLSISRTSPTGMDISHYIASFDDFTIAANRVFGEMNAVIMQSEKLISRKLETKKGENQPGNYHEFAAELEEALAKLRKTQESSDELERNLTALKKQWDKIKIELK
jgi:hypothetical protein